MEFYRRFIMGDETDQYLEQIVQKQAQEGRKELEEIKKIIEQKKVREGINTKLSKEQQQREKQKQLLFKTAKGEEIGPDKTRPWIEYPNVKSLLKDRNVALQSDFTEEEEKKQGASEGYIAKDKDSRKKFLFKIFYKSAEQGEKAIRQKYVNKLPDDELRDKLSNMRDNRRDGVLELISASIYEMLLFNRAPKEQLVISRDKDFLYLRSKYFDNSITLYEFAKIDLDDSTQTDDITLNFNSKNLKKVQGFAKIIAACDLLGDGDYHSANIMVQEQDNQDTQVATPATHLLVTAESQGINDKIWGLSLESTLPDFTRIADNQVKLIMTKLDHGCALTNFNKDFASWIKSTNENFKECGYQAAINEDNLKFNDKEYHRVLTDMINYYNEDRANNIISSAISTLQENGFDLTDCFPHSNNFEKLNIWCKKQLKENFDNMRQIATNIEIVTKFSSVAETFHDGKWVEEIATAQREENQILDPVLYASKNNIKIEGKNALIWAYDNDYKVKVFNPGVKEVNMQEESQWKKTSSGTYELKEKNIKKQQELVEEYYPIEVILFEKDDFQIPFSKDESWFFQYAVKK